MQERLRGGKPANGLRGASPQVLSRPVVPLRPGYATSEPWRVIEEHRIALVAPRETRRITSLSASTIRRLVEDGNFPRQFPSESAGVPAGSGRLTTPSLHCGPYLLQRHARSVDSEHLRLRSPRRPRRIQSQVINHRPRVRTGSRARAQRRRRMVPSRGTTPRRNASRGRAASDRRAPWAGGSCAARRDGRLQGRRSHPRSRR